MNAASAARVMVLLACTASAWATEAGRGPSKRFAVVVGNNVAPVADLLPLQFADDDAVRLHRLLSAAGYRARLLTVPDAETQALSPDAAAAATPPTRAALLSALKDTFGDMRAAQAPGVTVEFLFAFAGHGRGSAQGGAAVFLLDGPFTRQDLATHVVTASPADFNHVLVDAGDSYFMVAARGADGAAYPNDRVADTTAAGLIQQYLEGSGPAQDVRTGFLVSTNQAAAVHEYQEYRAGVFSHVIRSALLGAGDTNQDGRIEYSEAMAYAAAASQGITDVRAQLSLHCRPPPRDVHRPLLDLAQSDLRSFLRLGPELRGRVHLEDARGQRYADLHLPGNRAVLLALVPGSASYSVVREDGATARVSVARGAVTAAGFSDAALKPRGADSPLGAELFSSPFDDGFYRGFVASNHLVAAVDQGRFSPRQAASAGFLPPRPRLLFGLPGLGLLGAGGVLGAGAGLSLAGAKLSFDAYSKDLRRTGVSDVRREVQLHALRVAAGVLLAAGMAALALGAILVAVELLWPVRSSSSGETP